MDTRTRHWAVRVTEQDGVYPVVDDKRVVLGPADVTAVLLDVLVPEEPTIWNSWLKAAKSHSTAATNRVLFCCSLPDHPSNFDIL